MREGVGPRAFLVRRVLVTVERVAITRSEIAALKSNGQAWLSTFPRRDPV